MKRFLKHFSLLIQRPADKEPTVRYECIPGTSFSNPEKILAISTWPNGREIRTVVLLFPRNFNPVTRS